VRLYEGDSLAGESGSLTVDSTSAYVNLVEQILHPQEVREFELCVDLREAIGVESFRIGLNSGDVGVEQPGSALRY